MTFTTSTSPLNDAQIEQLWSSYKHDGTPSARVREQLIVHYTPLVRYVANKVAQTLPANADHADLVSYGTFGLIDAIDKFQPERGFKFETYAISRIKGNILDELRSIDWVPRSVRSTKREIDRTVEQLEADLHRSPTEHEVASAMDVDETVLRNARSRVATSQFGALDRHVGGQGEEGLTLGEMLADHSDDPSDMLEIGEMCAVLANAMTKPPSREQAVLTLYYFEGLTLAQIGEVIGVTESRVCQIHTRAILQLREHLQNSEREAE